MDARSKESRKRRSPYMGTLLRTCFAWLRPVDAPERKLEALFPWC